MAALVPLSKETQACGRNLSCLWHFLGASNPLTMLEISQWLRKHTARVVYAVYRTLPLKYRHSGINKPSAVNANECYVENYRPLFTGSHCQISEESTSNIVLGRDHVHFWGYGYHLCC